MRRRSNCCRTRRERSSSRIWSASRPIPPVCPSPAAGVSLLPRDAWGELTSRFAALYFIDSSHIKRHSKTYDVIQTRLFTATTVHTLCGSLKALAGKPFSAGHAKTGIVEHLKPGTSLAFFREDAQPTWESDWNRLVSQSSFACSSQLTLSLRTGRPTASRPSLPRSLRPHLRAADPPPRRG